MCYNVAKIQKVLDNRAQNTENYAQLKHFLYFLLKQAYFAFNSAYACLKLTDLLSMSIISCFFLTQ